MQPSHPNRQSTLGYLYALLCIFLWSLIPVVSRFGQSEMDNFQFLFWSNLLSLAVVTTCFFFTKSKKPIYKITIKNFFYTSFLGSLGCAFYYLCLYYGYAQSSGIEVLVVQYLWPVFIVLLSIILLKERLKISSILAIILGFLGILIVLTKGNISTVSFSNFSTVLIVALGSFSFALFSVLSKKLNSPNPYLTTVIFFIGGLSLAAFAMVLFSEFKLPSKSELLPVIVNGALINGISYIFWLEALNKIKASTAATLVFITPVLSSIYIVILFNEPFYTSYLFGLALVICSGYLSTRKS